MARLTKSTITSKDGRSLILRHVAPADAEAYLHFRGQIPHDSTHTMQYIGLTLPTIDEAKETLKTQQDDKISLCLGIFDDSKLVGYLNFRATKPGHPWLTHLGEFGMMVLKEYWGQGLGKRLLEQQDIHAKNCGIMKIEANVRTKNDRGLSLYKGCGFVIEGTRRKAAFINGEFEDEYFIAKFLDDQTINVII